MSEIAFDNFGFASTNEDIDYTVLAGRYMSEKGMEKRILKDIYLKLDLKDTDSLLEIGSGAGNLSIPLSFVVDSVSCCDHDLLMDRMKKRIPDADNIKYFPGNFLNISIDEEYDKILIYSVLHYLKNEKEVFHFIDKALSLLKDGGRLLLGDLANRDNENRFYNSVQGKKWIEKHMYENNKYKENGKKSAFSDYLVNREKDNSCIKIDDELIFNILLKFRKKGYKTFLLEQPATLPYGLVREDILIVKSL